VRAGVEQVAVRRENARNADLVVIGVPLVEPEQRDVAHVADDVLREVAEQDRLDAVAGVVIDWLMT
jgi:hypothetical protein